VLGVFWIMFGIMCGGLRLWLRLWHSGGLAGCSVWGLAARWLAGWPNWLVKGVTAEPKKGNAQTNSGAEPRIWVGEWLGTSSLDMKGLYSGSATETESRAYRLLFFLV